uniref:Uncharacterized protein n=1 Tax=Cacopsylla melanoneura TaxID=428564 RepID=A0A8D8YNY1_9HEMI
MWRPIQPVSYRRGNGKKMGQETTKMPSILRYAVNSVKKCTKIPEIGYVTFKLLTLKNNLLSATTQLKRKNPKRQNLNHGKHERSDQQVRKHRQQLLLRRKLA